MCREAWSASYESVPHRRVKEFGMRAGDLAQPYPTVTLRTPAIEAARLLGAITLDALPDRMPAE